MSHGWRKAAKAMGMKTNKASPYTPGTNGKTKQVIKTLLEELAYVRPHVTLATGNNLLPADLRICNGCRCQVALGGVTTPPTAAG